MNRFAGVLPGLIGFFLLGFFFYFFMVNPHFAERKYKEWQCSREAQEFFDTQNEIGKTNLEANQNYSFAKNKPRLSKLLGDDYKYVAIKEGDCFFIMRFYEKDFNNNQYVYQIYSSTHQEGFIPKLGENDYNPDTLKMLNVDVLNELFLGNYKEFFEEKDV